MNNQDNQWSEWLAAARNGDNRAYHSFITAVDSYLRKVLKQRIKAGQLEDVIQEVLLAIHRARHTWRENDPILPWLHGIVRYKTADHFRKLYRVQEVEVQNEHAYETYAAPAEENEDLTWLLKGLTPKQYALLSLTKGQEFTSAETGQQLGMSPSAVKVAVHRLVKMLQNRHSRTKP